VKAEAPGGIHGGLSGTDITKRTAVPRQVVTFGYDVVDLVEDGRGNDAVGAAPDVVDVLESRKRDIPTRCTQCGEAWLMGPEALATGKCWPCRTNGGGRQ
jgi:hypothetical protein